MPSPLSDLLEGSARAAYGFLESAAASPASANQILQQLADAGFSIRRQTGLDIIASLRGAASTARVARLLPVNTIIPPSLITPSPHPLTNNFSFRVKVNNAPFGMPQFVNVPSNVPLSVNDIFSVATSYLTAGDSPTIGGTMDQPPDLTLDRALQQSADFTGVQLQDFLDAQQSLLEPVGSIGPGGVVATGPEGFGHGL